MKLKIFLLLSLISILLIYNGQGLEIGDPNEDFFVNNKIKQQSFDLSIKNDEFIETLRNNKWGVFYLNIGIFVMIYFSAVFLVPYIRLAIDIRNLEKEEDELVKTRKKIERNYFKRKIDKETFRKLLTKNRNNLYQLRSKLKNREGEFEKLNRKVFYPNEFFPYFKLFTEFIGEKVQKFKQERYKNR
ncbi:MAG: hypothetical protein ABEK36_03860 [Candidatus Aenigmatarchaeota archaeon]